MTFHLSGVPISWAALCRRVLFAAMLAAALGCAPGIVRPAAAQTPLREMNYYAKDHAWDHFWEDWTTGTKTEMDNDLYTISNMGCNTVRIFIDAPVFGYPTPSSTYMTYFEDCLSLISSHGLKAHVTLFDCWSTWSDISGSKTWCQAVVGAHQNDSRVAVWELHNELDFSNSSVKTWYANLYPYMKQQAGSTLCTVSTYHVGDLATIKSIAPPDLYDYHYYTSYFYWTNNLQGDINTAKSEIGSARLLIGETGENTWDSSEQTQYNFYRDVLYILQHNSITDIGVWTLWDFPSTTTQCGGYVPPRDQDYYGLYRYDGSAKPAEQLVSNDFHGSPPTSASQYQVFNPSFEDVNANNGNSLYNWSAWSSNGSGVTFAQDTSVHNAGGASVKITSNPGVSVGIWNEAAIPVSPSLRYSLYGYAETQNLAGNVELVFSWYDSNANWITDTTSAQLTTVNQSTWALLQITGAAPPSNAAYVKVYCQMYSTTTSYVWFDDVTFNGQPDLVVTNASWSPSSPIMDDHVVFTATVKNQGGAPTPNGTIVGVGFYIDGSEVNWGGLSDGLDAGATTTVTADGGPSGVNYWTAAFGSHTLESYVNDVDRINESNFTNNALDSTVNVTAPDLIVTSLTWSPASPVNGNHVVFTAVVKNQGNAATPAGVIIGVGFYVDGKDVTWSSNDTTSLAPGASVTLSASSGPNGVNYWVATTGSHTVEAYVNDADRFPESNMNNNTLTKSLTVN